jgi:hypothetical protein
MSLGSGRGPDDSLLLGSLSYAADVVESLLNFIVMKRRDGGSEGGRVSEWWIGVRAVLCCAVLCFHSSASVGDENQVEGMERNELYRIMMTMMMMRWRTL